MSHLHRCADCVATLYRCHEVGSREEGCANARPGDKEYCEHCQTSDDDAMHDAIDTDDESDETQETQHG